MYVYIYIYIYIYTRFHLLPLSCTRLLTFPIPAKIGEDWSTTQAPNLYWTATLIIGIMQWASSVNGKVGFRELTV